MKDQASLYTLLTFKPAQLPRILGPRGQGVVAILFLAVPPTLEQTWPLGGT